MLAPRVVPDSAFKLIGERVIPAGIEHEDAQIFCLRQVRDHLVHPDHAA